MSDRLDRIRAAMAEVKLDGLLVSVPVDDGFGRHGDNRKYVSGFTGSAGMALVTATKALFAADFRYTEQAEAECEPRGMDVFKALGNADDWVPVFLNEAGMAGKKLGVSKADSSLDGYLALKDRIDKMEERQRPHLVAAPKIIETLRRRKDADELALIQRAIDIADEAYEAIIDAAGSEDTELELAARFTAAVVERGAEGISFETIVASGPRSAMPHASPTAATLGAGAPIVFDCGAQFAGYCSDLTRTTVIGQADARFREIYDIVFEAQQTAIERVEPGMKGPVAHRLAADVIERHGYGERFGHGLGHGVGLEVHEAPYVGLSSTDVLEDGMVFTIEPGIYLPGWGGIRIEDVVVLENGKARVLSHARKLTPTGVGQ
jgi:Xaa-Pro aminopeptidase